MAAAKSMASPAAAALLLAALALMLAAPAPAQARPSWWSPAPVPTPAPMISAAPPTTPAPASAPAPAPSQAVCPAGFKNLLEYTEAVVPYAERGIILSLSLVSPSSGLPGVVISQCICYPATLLGLLFGPIECVRV